MPAVRDGGEVLGEDLPALWGGAKEVRPASDQEGQEGR